MKIVFEFYERENLIFTTDKRICLVGKSTECDIRVDLDGFSRKHCQIEVVGDDVFITDLGSTNGVEINEKRINAQEKTLYHLFLPLRIGPTKSVEITL